MQIPMRFPILLFEDLFLEKSVIAGRKASLLGEKGRHGEKTGPVASTMMTIITMIRGTWRQQEAVRTAVMVVVSAPVFLVLCLF